MIASLLGACGQLSPEFAAMLSGGPFRTTAAAPAARTAAATTAAPTFLDDAALAALYRDTIRQASSDSGDTFVIESRADGTQTLTAGGFTDSGTWAVRGGEVCETWTKVLEGGSRCWRFAHLGGQTYRAYDAQGQPDTTQTITPR